MWPPTQDPQQAGRDGLAESKAGESMSVSLQSVQGVSRVWGVFVGGGGGATARVCVCVCMYVCMCARERERVCVWVVCATVRGVLYST